jgi:hypothetical protein
MFIAYTSVDGWWLVRDAVISKHDTTIGIPEASEKLHVRFKSSLIEEQRGDDIERACRPAARRDAA